MLQSKYLLLVIISTTFLFGCIKKHTTHSYFEIPITVKAEIIEYYSGAMHIDYDNGNGATYDSTIFHIISTEKYAGKEISIYHEVVAEPDSIYRQKGLICEFVIDERVFQEIVQVDFFVTAIEKSLKVRK